MDIQIALGRCSNTESHDVVINLYQKSVMDERRPIWFSSDMSLLFDRPQWPHGDTLLNGQCPEGWLCTGHTALLNGHALSEVTRLVHVAVTHHGDVVAEQL